ncbi:MAG: Glucosamine-6-phosphate deaminase 1 [candidate division BRC1 bacterium ADurb.BinA364]|nr:MAG: Glucosamine-6-phosphate deaminase 1 [candidate division BRC1 bacterium ADurb.BinA364]
MIVRISESKTEMGRLAAESGAALIRDALGKRGEAFVILATGASQFEMLESLAAAPIDWPRVTVFHLDEYIGLPITHPASFRKYLKERFADKLPAPLKAFHYIDGEAAPPEAECARIGALISAVQINVAFVGIGENCHLAFNDPPADFETETPYIIVDLDEACRRQQLGEGWFPDYDSVPRRAISMSIRQIMKAGAIVCTVPDSRKADAVRKALEGPISPEAPASILRRHADCRFFLDRFAAQALSQRYSS